MKLVDRALPAAQYLVGPDIHDLLRVPVEAAGGVLESVRPAHVQYRPGADVVVRYTASVSWNGQPPKRETFAAASTLHGPLPGTLTLTAELASGNIDVGVWRWPFDPVLTGLANVVSVEPVADFLQLADPTGLSIEVVAYRPTDRVVVRIDRKNHPLAYLKVVDPTTAAELVDRHERLRAASVPVPDVMNADIQLGIVALAPLVGPTLRELLKAAPTPTPATLPPASEFDRLADAFAAAELDTTGPQPRLSDGVLHARMLATVTPRLESRLNSLADHFAAAPPLNATATVHGDLHEGQLIVTGTAITGVLDIDDAGPGNPIDDRSNLIARLEFRALNNPAGSDAIQEYAATIRSESAHRFDSHQLDLHIAACLVGLATGPFRLQATDWQSTVERIVDRAEQLVAS